MMTEVSISPGCCSELTTTYRYLPFHSTLTWQITFIKCCHAPDTRKTIKAAIFWAFTTCHAPCTGQPEAMGIEGSVWDTSASKTRTKFWKVTHQATSLLHHLDQEGPPTAYHRVSPLSPDGHPSLCSFELCPSSLPTWVFFFSSLAQGSCSSKKSFTFADHVLPTLFSASVLLTDGHHPVFGLGYQSCLLIFNHLFHV